MKMNHLFVITGATAVGEDSILNGLMKKRPLAKIITSVTRPMRPSESEGSPYYFISDEEFRANINADRMVEYAVGSNDALYGVTKQEFERHSDAQVPVIWKIDFKGARRARELFPECTIIYITVPSLDVIKERLIKRDKGASEAYIEERLAYAREWEKHTDLYDHTVVNANGKLQQSIAQVDDIITKKLLSSTTDTL